jgi:magnesium chelatase family protein
MVARVNTVAFQGIEVRAVDVQVQLSNGLPAFNIVGLPDKAVAESKERVRAALHALGLSLPPKRLTVNIAPADLSKEGSHFDLPIALGVLGAMGVLPKEELAELWCWENYHWMPEYAQFLGFCPQQCMRLRLGIV